jgi:hypothetical protein
LSDPIVTSTEVWPEVKRTTVPSIESSDGGTGVADASALPDEDGPAEGGKAGVVGVGVTVEALGEFVHPVRARTAAKTVTAARFLRGVVPIIGLRGMLSGAPLP